VQFHIPVHDRRAASLPLRRLSWGPSAFPATVLVGSGALGAEAQHGARGRGSWLTGHPPTAGGECPAAGPRRAQVPSLPGPVPADHPKVCGEAPHGRCYLDMITGLVSGSRRKQAGDGATCCRSSEVWISGE
jgi:hypothetical protein